MATSATLPLRRLAAGTGRAVAIALVLLWSLGPILLIAIAAFTPEKDIFSYGARPPWRPTIENFAMLWAKWGDFFAGLANSLIVTAGATMLAVSVSTLAGFGFSRWRSRALAASAFGMIAVRLLPPIVTTLPLFPIVNWLGINDTHAVLILLYATFFVSMGTMIMRTFIDQIPRELDEAAMVDGASQLDILRKVVLPLCGQGMIAVAIFVIVYAWNEFLFALIFTTKAAKTAPLVMSEMMGSLDGVEWGVVFAATLVQLLPVLAFVVLSQRFLIAGLTAGATKG